MSLISEEQFTGMFRDCDTAFRWEAQRSYRTSDAEAEALARFTAGDPPTPDEYPEWQSWLDFIRELTGQGKTISRIRVVDGPPTGYQRWAMQAARYHVEAGENIRWLPRATAVSLGIPMNDWWLFNDTSVVLMRFTDAGVSMTLATGPEITRYRAWRDLAAGHATTTETV